MMQSHLQSVHQIFSKCQLFITDLSLPNKQSVYYPMFGIDQPINACLAKTV